mgnify:CR=1 FL=1
MDVNAVFLQVVTGLQLGAIYALIALGLTLIFGTLGVVNFAHGALYLIAIYSAVVIASHTNFLVAIVVVPLLLFLVGIVMERGLIRWFYNRPHTDQILVTFGLAIVVEEVMKWVFGANNIPFNLPAWGSGIFIFYGSADAIPPAPVFAAAPKLWVPFLEGFVTYQLWRVILVAVSAVTIVALFCLLQFTNFGLTVRAGMRDPQMVKFLGVNVMQKFAIVFGLGAAIAGIAGVFGGPITQVTPGVGMMLLVPSFLVVVIGGMGSLPGALIASLIIGLALSFSAENANLQQIVVYLIAVVVLLVRPRGLLGKKGVFE